MSDHHQQNISDFPWLTQAVFYAKVGSLIVCAIFIIAFLQVTLRKAFELTDPWQVFYIFVGSIAACAVYYRIVVPRY